MSDERAGSGEAEGLCPECQLPTREGEHQVFCSRAGSGEAERLRSALTRIADGDVDGVGDYSECVQLYARQVLAAPPDAERAGSGEADLEGELVRWEAIADRATREAERLRRAIAVVEAAQLRGDVPASVIRDIRMALRAAQPDAEWAPQGGRTCPECGSLGEWNACPHDVERAPQPEPRQDEQ